MDDAKPISQVDTFSPEMQRLLQMIETNLYFTVKNVQTLEEALAIRQAFQRPLGVLNSRFNLTSNSTHRRKPLTNRTDRE